MALSDIYNQIPYDMSGSTSKNRFRQELFWGISKMFDLYSRDDFCIVFDYKCDVEIHLNDALEFYQIKSHKVQRPYTFTTLKKTDSGKHSILAKLYVLKDLSSPNMPIRCAIVSNAFFQVGKTLYSDSEVISFDDLSDKDKDSIRQALGKELERDKIDLGNLQYIYTSMNLLSPQNDLKGKITGSFELIKGCEPIKPNALYRLIVETVEEKACYEFSSEDYEELKERKGITKAALDTMLNLHMRETDNSVELVRAFIDQKVCSVGQKHKLKTSLAKMIELNFSSAELRDKEKEILLYITDNNSDMSVEQMVDVLMERFESTFSIEYSFEDKYVFILLIVKRWEEGQYEQAGF